MIVISIIAFVILVVSIGLFVDEWDKVCKEFGKDG